MGQPRRVLPADVYDALELSALANGGIGFGLYYEALDPEQPCCAIGHSHFLVDYEVASALRTAGINESTNDIAVKTVLGPGKAGRITFAEWCQALGVVRGE